MNESKRLQQSWCPYCNAPAGESREIFTVIFVAFAAPTAVYLLILSWRAAYLSGMGKR